MEIEVSDPTVQDVGQALLEVAADITDYDDDGLALLADGLLPGTASRSGAAKIRCIAQHLARSAWWATATLEQIRELHDCGMSDDLIREISKERTDVWAGEAETFALRAVMLDRGYVS